MQLGSMFICNCNIALHVSDAFCFHLQEQLETVEAASVGNVTLYYIVTYPVTLVQPVYTPVYVSFVSCRMSLTRGCFYSS